MLIKVNWSVFICVLGAYDIYIKKNTVVLTSYNTTPKKIKNPRLIKIMTKLKNLEDAIEKINKIK